MHKVRTLYVCEVLRIKGESCSLFVRFTVSSQYSGVWLYKQFLRECLATGRSGGPGASGARPALSFHVVDDPVLSVGGLQAGMQQVQVAAEHGDVGMANQPL